MLGDWGGLPLSPYRTYIEQCVAESLDTVAWVYDTQFQVALGDNFYYEGVRDVHDKRFQVSFSVLHYGTTLTPVIHPQ